MDLQVILNEYTELEKRELSIAGEKEAILKKNNEIFKAISALDKEANDLVAKREEVKVKLLEAMETFDVKKFENDYIAVTYVAPSTRVTLDSKALKEDLPDIYEQYSRTSDVKASLRIKAKDAE